MLMDMYELYQLNNDVVGFIYIKDTNINNPVLQRKSKKDYYLYRDFYGNEDRHGSVYVREVCDVFGPSDNVTIYGHNMADGTMFANLHKYKDKDFFNAHPVVYFDTLYERHTYQVVCIFRTSGTYGEGFPYHLYDDFKDEAEYNAFIKGVRKLAIFDSGISVNYGDKFICLSTCEEWPIKNGRLVLLAVRIA
jgi:sortase B